MDNFMDYIYRDFHIMQQTYATLVSVNNKIQIQTDKYSDNITSRQYMTILAIFHLPEDETTLNNIAKKLGTTKQNIKQIINILEGKGYVQTMPSKQDKRAINVSVTKEGWQVAESYAEKSFELFGDIFNDFSVEEMKILWMLLKKLYRFDGEEQDGFEEDANPSGELTEEQIEMAEAFARRRREKYGSK
ncbi:DNA-binding MarR family transcriptional regulator [Clostridium acetobutylicum]|uniref:Transcriptional regulator, MarR/EmrR family n=1 Tax=Clostridium acetobutylicum (strain ATCC 824 / DSM 792 / JCM 1419 / IAM 19013 / LMG 5710 / NBRC 13948 / NRRL B-527 / VKM B-1787 / 2291 / W) TaxID=272562 RepID=Q97DR6_CLOAB|nr:MULTISPECIES: MarR family transcriptional regulator [Clostridium]AAK81336.1 Transcriptional regulator, MarR/EmrR family [Clostridium acetobutylicum ATCC 824]ADZ22446.1 Transcriptional regulator, MarR/EmrR family [Clostridium acetobutylicum EA 2018]AEI32826.1 MarR family transcriptional regulator [Clostridium acetobutylicum DSM 1731]AWV80997.1 MarR family transcriptional regulator [Clostridium acetobutylicum]MBC2395510.1 MarR family transcriptional regulator [Clostridium acetobutylicum]